MELATGCSVLHMSARAIESFSEEIWVMIKEKGGQLEQTKKTWTEIPHSKVRSLRQFSKEMSYLENPLENTFQLSSNFNNVFYILALSLGNDFPFLWGRLKIGQVKTDSLLSLCSSLMREHFLRFVRQKSPYRCF